MYRRNSGSSPEAFDVAHEYSVQVFGLDRTISVNPHPLGVIFGTSNLEAASLRIRRSPISLNR